jgi:hypothetical protein
MRRGGINELQERTVTGEIQIRGKDMFGLFAARRVVWDGRPIAPHPCQMGGLQPTPERVAHDACLQAVVESHDGQEASQEDTGGEQPKGCAPEALNEKHRAKAQQGKTGPAFCIEAARGVQAQEAPVEAGYLASQGVYFIVLHKGTFVGLCR